MSKVKSLIDSIPRFQREHEFSAELLFSIQEELHLDVSLEDEKEAAREVTYLRIIKAALKLAVEAVNEQLDVQKDQLYDLMVASEVPSFTWPLKGGSNFHLKEQVYVKANVEYDSERLISVLGENGLPDLAKKSVNAQSFGAAIREIMKTQDESGRDVYDESRVPKELLELCVVTRIGEVGVRKDGK